MACSVDTSETAQVTGHMQSKVNEINEEEVVEEAKLGTWQTDLISYTVILV